MKILFTSTICFVFITAMISCGSKEEVKGSGEKSSLKAEGYLVTASDFDNTVMTTANLLANEQVELKAPISGQVLEINFKEGQSVRQGQSIIRLDDRVWRAQLIGLEAQLKTAESDYERKKSLLKFEGSSEEEVEQAFSTVEVLKSQIQQLKINISLANVTAPFSGVVGMRNFSKGAYLKEGESITFLAEAGQLKIDFKIAQEYRNSLEVGKSIKVLVEKDTLEASIYAINPLIEEGSRTINVRAILQQPKTKIIMPGSYAQVFISTNFSNNALLIPTQAVIPEINTQTVYLYKNGKAVKQVVRIGNRNSDKVHILEGINEGDTVIITGLMQIKEGMEIILQSVKK